MSDAGSLDDLALLRFLPDAARSAAVRRFVPLSFPFGAVIVAEGTTTDAMYVLIAGRARLVRRGLSGDELPIGVLQPGDTFGDTEILQAAPRPTSVRASSSVLALRLDAEALRALIADHPDIRTYLELQQRYGVLQRHFRSLPAFGRLTPRAVAAVAAARLDAVDLPPGAVVYGEDDPPGPAYLIEDGSLRATEARNGRQVHVANVGAGESCGVAEAVGDEARTATLEAITAARLIPVDGQTLADLAAELPDFRATLDDLRARHAYRAESALPEALAHEILPAAASASPTVDDAQVDRTLDDDADPDAAFEAAPFADGGHFVKRRRRARLPFIQQLDEVDCGAACLAMVTRGFGRRVSLARIRELLDTGLDGTSLRSICRAGEELGLATRSVKASPEHLDAMPLPAIVHWDAHHWVVAVEVARRHVYVVDPAAGPRRLTRDDFREGWSGYAALFDYTPKLEDTPETPRLLGWMWPIVRPHRRLLAQVIGLAVVVGALQMVLPVFTQIVVDRVLVEQDVALLHVLVAALGATMLFIVLSLLTQRYLLSFVAVRIDAVSLDVLTRRLLALPLAYFASRRTGDLQRRLDGIRQVRDVLLQSGIAGITAVAQLAATTALMLAYSPWLTAVFFITAPVYGLLMVAAARRLRPMFADLEASFGRYSSYQIDAIKGIEQVKALGAEPAFRRLLLDQFHRVAGRVFLSDFLVMGYEAAIDTLTSLGIGMFLWAGAYEVLGGRLTIGALMAFNSLVALATIALRQMLLLWDNVQRCDVLLNRLDDVFQHTPEQGVDRTRLRPVRSLSGQVSLRNVGFRYGGPDAPAILDGITFDVPAGRMIAIAGRSGSGKTTLARCLAGLLEPTAGSISFDGVELTTLNYRDLRRHIGIVPQDPFVFSDTIARNIAFGEDEPDMARVVRAAEAARAHEFIERLPFGYETPIGETGLALSGGQRQRVCLARAVYNRPPILILDEATNALDAESERAVQQSLATLLQGRTAFVIAHRLSTVRHADHIVVLDGGRIVEQGAHDELMRRRGFYYHLASQQLGLSA
jgi:ATP-binding cassette subfamily B protein